MRLATNSLFLVLFFTTNVALAEKLTPQDFKATKKIINNLCIACHAADGNSLIPANPKLAGQHAAYITKQLLNFKSGVRDNIVMAGMVANLTEQDMRNLGLFYETQPLALAEAKKNGVETGDVIIDFKVENLNRPNKAIVYPFALIILLFFGYFNYRKKEKKL